MTVTIPIMYESITTNKKECVIYPRVSSREQEESGYSLEAQVKLLSEYANVQGFRIVKVYKISESASTGLVRKVFNEMLRDVARQKTPVIICEKVDRLTRNLKDAAIVDDWVKADSQRQVHFVKESFILSTDTKSHENLVWDMKVAIARFYTNNLSEEVKKGQKEKIAQGWLPAKSPPGYLTTGETGHKIHVIDESKSSLIRKMYEYYATGNFSLAVITKKMYEEGLRNKNNNKIVKSKIHTLLTDPFYYGKIRWNGEIYDGKQEPIIDKELFDSVQNILRRKTANPNFQKHMTVFKGKIKCGDCDKTVTWERQRNKWYGGCKHCRGKKYIRQREVEKQLFPLFDKISPKNDKVLKVLEGALKGDHATEIQYYKKKKETLESGLSRIQKRIETMYEDKLDGVISEEFYHKKFKEFTLQKETLESGLKDHNENNTEYYKAGYAIHDLACKAKRIYQSSKATVEDRRMLLSLVFSSITLCAGEIRPNYTLAFEFLLKWMHMVNKELERKKVFDYKTLTQKDLKIGSLLRG